MDENCGPEQLSALSLANGGDAAQHAGDFITRVSDASESEKKKKKKKKKAGFEELNGDAGSEDEVESAASQEIEELNLVSCSAANGRKQFLDTNFNPRYTAKAIAHSRVSTKTKNYNQKNSMDKKNDKAFENKSRDSRGIEKKDALSFLNGVITNNSGYITNGFSVKASADNDGSGSESGYTTTKKRKGRRNSDKGAENLNLFQDKTMHHEGNPIAPQQDLENMKFEATEHKANRLENTKPSGRYEPVTVSVTGARGKAGIGDTQRKNSDGKLSCSKKYEERPKSKAASVTSKEDSWTLFKPPPVFPVDNSSAKTVPKISYASKVKENLNKSPPNQSAVDTQALASGRLSQVPMSAVKAVTSSSFSNGLASGVTDGNIGASGVQTVTAANTVVHVSSGSETLLSSDGLDQVTAEQKKQGLFVYPSNMQSVLPSTAQAELPSQTTQQNLGDIFQNQWGLSFINEPSAGPELATVRSVDNPPLEVTFQAECAATLVSQCAELLSPGSEIPMFPKAYELDKRTSPQVLSSVVKTGWWTAGVSAEGVALSVEPHVTELQKVAASSQGAIVFVPKDFGNETPQRASPTNPLVPSAKEHTRYHRGFDRKDSLGSFDLKSAVMYHTKEMDSLWSLHKQDPSRVVTYDESMDRPDQ
ncbi:LOW QUALITY PROTEIN: nuclear fragile X mental retardation-interacting protein 2 [Callorhinchus milii]|uniref:LOW QUALITY PROTEIN: nuclear fragile X mental retardation-interacting protein 2 n=1 Tax=Callorhinchus milii TaxID=7868 RepID=UPI001C3F5271|nr:LOW QUALITY PROTEIN: nuclear fragile X mental retardation-interacting protein 2 [Callorhinchus milii]